MRILKRWFGGDDPRGAEPGSRLPPAAPVSQKSGRRDLLRLVLRDTLQLHGVPTDWICAELLTSTLVNGEQGSHWRLQVRHWDPRLLTCGVALQHALMEHLLALDPQAREWLTGISWQFSLSDESHCPPMPPPRAWRAAPLPLPLTRRPDHDVDNARAMLNRWLAHSDTDAPRQLDSLPPTWARTQPADP
jgi:hypothetical protein